MDNLWITKEESMPKCKTNAVKDDRTLYNRICCIPRGIDMWIQKLLKAHAYFPARYSWLISIASHQKMRESQCLPTSRFLDLS